MVYGKYITIIPLTSATDTINVNKSPLLRIIKKKIKTEVYTCKTLKREKHFQEYFDIIQTKQDRNLFIINEYMDGYTQVEVAEYLGVSKYLISKIIKVA